MWDWEFLCHENRAREEKKHNPQLAKMSPIGNVSMNILYYIYICM